MADIFYDRVVDDIVLENGDLKLTSDVGRTSSGVVATTRNAPGIGGGEVTEEGIAEGIRQNIVSTLLTFAGEYFLDTEDSNIGVPWIQEIFSVVPLQVDKAERIIRNTILDVEGVASIDDMNIDFTSSDRTMGVEFIARTENGILVSDNVQVRR